MNYSDLSVFPIRYTQIDEMLHAYIDEGQGTPIFFLHGFPDHAGGWDSIISELKKTNRCIAPFLRGYYPTSLPSNNDYSIRTISKDVNALAHSLGIKKYVVIGQDWGATVAYTMASYFQKEVEGVVALSMPHPLYLTFDMVFMHKARHIPYFMDSDEAFGRLNKNNFEYLETLYKRWSPNFNFEKLKEQMVMLFSIRAYAEGALAYYWQLKVTNGDKAIVDKYKQVAPVPILTLVGKKDGSININHFEKMSLDNRFDVKVHNTAGHFIHREDPDYCIRNIKTFLNKTKTPNTPCVLNPTSAL